MYPSSFRKRSGENQHAHDNRGEEGKRGLDQLNFGKPHFSATKTL